MQLFHIEFFKNSETYTVDIEIKNSFNNTLARQVIEKTWIIFPDLNYLLIESIRGKSCVSKLLYHSN